MLKGIIIVMFGMVTGSILPAQVNASSEKLTVVVYDFPPDIVNAASAPTGPFIDKLKRIATRAGFEIEWLLANMTAETTMLDSGERPFCTTGRVYSADRAKKWRFVPYLFAELTEDVIVARPDKLKALQKFNSIEAILKNPTYTGVFVRGGYYGEEAKTLIAMQKPWLLEIATSEEQALRVVATGRADYAIVAMQTWHAGHYRNFELQGLASIDLIPGNSGSPVLLACSKALPDRMFNKLSTAMAELGFKNHTP